MLTGNWCKRSRHHGMAKDRSKGDDHCPDFHGSVDWKRLAVVLSGNLVAIQVLEDLV